MKSEPETYSIDDLKRDKKTLWEGVRNYQARNFMAQEMQVGDAVLFYHSNAEPPGVAGVARVSKAAVADPTQFDKKSDYFDPAAKPNAPRWLCVEIEFVEKFKNFVSLNDLREDAKLKEMMVLRKGQRLSVQPVTSADFQIVQKKGKA